MSVRRLLNQTCIIHRRKLDATPGDWGESNELWKEQYVGVPCYKYSVSGTEYQRAVGILAILQEFISFDRNTDVTLSDEVTVEGERYRVTRLASPRGHHITAQVSRVEATGV